MNRISARAGAGLLAAFTLLYLPVTLATAASRYLWNDELFTWYIAHRPGFAGIWSALMTGAEQMPPFSFLATRASWALFGTGPAGTRMPEIVGFWVMCAALLVFTARRMPSSFAALAMVAPLTTGAYYYASEARPYGMVLGFAAVALVCWQNAAEGRHRALSLAGLTLALWGGVSSHYYAVLVLPALGLGELVRTGVRRRVDVPVWAAMVLGLAPLALYLPLIHAARAYAAHFWAHPKWYSAAVFYNKFLFGQAGLPLAAALLLGALWAARTNSAQERRGFGLVPIHEIAAAFGFLFIPLMGLALAMTVTKAFSERYVIACLVGCGPLLAWGYHALCPRRAYGWMAVAIFATLFVSREGARVFMYREETADRYETAAWLGRSTDPRYPIAIINSGLYFELCHMAPRDIGRRLIYLADPEASMRFIGNDTAERGLLTLRAFTPTDVRELRPYLATRPAFYVHGYQREAEWGWLLGMLPPEQWDMRIVAVEGDRVLYFVKPRAPA